MRPAQLWRILKVAPKIIWVGHPWYKMLTETLEMSRTNIRLNIFVVWWKEIQDNRKHIPEFKTLEQKMKKYQVYMICREPTSNRFTIRISNLGGNRGIQNMGNEHKYNRQKNTHLYLITKVKKLFTMATEF